jgi:PhnB protein
MSNVKPIPEGYHSVTPYLIVDKATQVIEFLERTFGAQVLMKMENRDGSIGHSELRVGDSVIMLAGARAEWKAMPTMIHVYVEDADAVYAKALEAGATAVQEMRDQFYGDRSGGVKDVSGNLWWIATHKEDLSVEELTRRHEAARGAHSG